MESSYSYYLHPVTLKTHEATARCLDSLGTTEPHTLCLDTTFRSFVQYDLSIAPLLPNRNAIQHTCILGEKYMDFFSLFFTSRVSIARLFVFVCGRVC